METGKSKIKVLADSVSGESQLPSSQRAVFSLYSHRVEGNSVGSHRDDNPIHGDSAFQRPCLLISSHQGLGFIIGIWGRDGGGRHSDLKQLVSNSYKVLTNHSLFFAYMVIRFMREKTSY